MLVVFMRFFLFPGKIKCSGETRWTMWKIRDVNIQIEHIQIEHIWNWEVRIPSFGGCRMRIKARSGRLFTGRNSWRLTECAFEVAREVAHRHASCNLLEEKKITALQHQQN